MKRLLALEVFDYDTESNLNFSLFGRDPETRFSQDNDLGEWFLKTTAWTAALSEDWE